MESVYTLTQIKESWEAYQSTKVLKILKHGKWKIHRDLSIRPTDATKAEVVKINTAMSFPKFLEMESD